MEVILRRERFMDVWLALLAVIGTAFTVLGGVATALFTFLRVRESARLVLLEEQVKTFSHRLTTTEAENERLRHDLANANGQIAVLTKARDRQRQEIWELSRRLEIFQKAADLIPATIVVDERERITDWDATATLMFHYTADEAIGRPVSELIIPPYMRGQHQTAFAYVMKTNRAPRSFPITAMAMNAQGVEFKVEISLSAPWEVDGGGKRIPARIKMVVNGNAKKTDDAIPKPE